MLHVREPVLPPFLDRLEVEGLRVGGGRVGLEFRGHGDRTLANLLGMTGEPIRVRIGLAQAACGPTSAGPGRRPGRWGLRAHGRGEIG